MAAAPHDTSLALWDVPSAPLTLERVGVARAGMTLLAGLTLEVEPGSALVLRGPNGAGKTTLLRSLAGLQPLADGAATPGPDAIAYASHADGLKSALTVSENLAFWARIYGHQEIAGAMAEFDLTRLATRRAATLSAGQKRRLGLARLLLTRRPIWLLDEPTVSLDQAATQRFGDIVEAHLARGGIAVIATHIALGLRASRDLDLTHYRPTAPTAGTGPQDQDLFAADDDGGAFL